MGLLDRAIQRGVSRAVGNAVEQGVRKAVEPKIEQAAANVVNSAANSINNSIGTQQTQNGGNQPQYNANPQQSAVNQAEVQQAASTLGGLFGGLTTYANEAAKNMKICPSCGEGTGADVKFCPKCGGKMPEQTLGQGAVCSSCGKQNNVGTKFCQECGAKLPSAIAEEQAAQAKDATVMSEWDAKLSAFPKWNCGGSGYEIEQQDWAIMFSVKMQDSYTAQNAVRQYRDILQQNGFRQAGQYPDLCHLYKKENGVCYHCDTEHCFDGDSNYPSLYFNNEEPTGGFDYVKPEQKKNGLFNLFK